MSKKQESKEQLISLLQNAYPRELNSKELAESLDVTTRSIRNYIRELIDEGYQISSSKCGYKYQSGIIQREISLDRESLKIIRLILSKSQKGINKVDTINALHISEATFNRRLKIVSEFLENSGLKLVVKNHFLILEGAEVKKRHLIYLLLHKESQRNILQELNLSSVQMSKTRQILEKKVKKYHLQINDGTFNNILMHLSISVFRLSNYHNLNSSFNQQIHTRLLHSPAYTVADDIMHSMQRVFNIEFNKNEVDNLTLLIIDTVNIQKNNTDHLKDYIDRRFILLSNLVIGMIDRTYNIDLSTNQAFVSRFALHLQNLYYRLQRKSNLGSNELINKNIKDQFPFIYEISVYASSQISDIFENYLSEAEINLIALHIGTLFISEENIQKKHFILVDKNYLNSNNYIVQKFNTIFLKNAVIDHVYQSYNALSNDYNPLNIITTIEPALNTKMLLISPFLTDDDLDKIKERISFLNQAQRSSFLFQYLSDFLPKSLVFHEKYFDKSTEYINFLCDQMKDLGYVDSSFKAEVLKREQLSSTDFVNNIAIPHTLKPTTQKTTISVIINKKPTKWHKNFVNVIVLLGLSRNDHAAFQTILDAIISILSEPSKVKQIIEGETYEDLLSIINQSLI